MIEYFKGSVDMYGFMSFGVTPGQLVKAMKGEAEAGRYYKKLIGLAPDEKEADIINHFLEDEAKHYSKFKMLYKMFTGKVPELPTPVPPDFSTYTEGVEQAILDELEAYEFYRDIYLSTNNMIVRDIFFEALTDENEHAAHLNYLYSKNRSKNKRNPQTFTLEQLQQYNGKNGNPAYVAVNGTVYDVTDSAAWAAATHFGLQAGKDHTQSFASCHQGQQQILQKLKIVGTLS